MGDSRLILIGKVQKPKGLKGEVRVAMTPDTLGRLGELRALLFEKASDQRSLRIERGAAQGNSAVLKFEGVDTIEAAETLRDGELYILGDELPGLPEGTYYQFELVDFEVVFEDGSRLGGVREVIDYPSCDALSVVLDGGREVLLPMTKSVILEIDKAGRRIRVSRAAVRDLLA